MNSSENFPGEVSRNLDSRSAYDALKTDVKRREGELAEAGSRRLATEEGLRELGKGIESDEALLEKYEENHSGEFPEETKETNL